MIDTRELFNRIEGMIAEPHSERGQEIIHGDRSHVTEVWEDGELTTTKAGELYNARRLHRLERPFLPEGQVLYSYDLIDDHEEYEKLKRRDEHKRMVVADKDALDVIAEYREITVNSELVEFLEENGYYDD